MPTGFEPMLCDTIDVVPEDDSMWVMEPKLDGWRAVAGVPTAADASPWMETRSGNRIRSLPYLLDALSALPEGTILDGEIVDPEVEGGGWNRVQSLASRKAQHDPSPDDPALHYVVFDVMIAAGEDVRHLPLSARRELLEILVPGDGLIVLSEWLAPEPDLLDDLLDRGYEGVVVKQLTSTYHNGLRGTWWCKLKPQTTDDDVLCVGFYDASPGSKYEGRAVGGIRFLRQNGYEGRCAGMDDVLRERMFTHPDEFVGRVFEVVHHGETADGALRHPNWKRWRDDRSADEFGGSAKVSHGKRTPPKKAPAKRVAARGGTRRDVRAGVQTIARPKVEPAAPAPRTAPTAPTGTGKRRIRNYAQMGQEKLVASYHDLRAGSGPHYDKCVHTGSGDPAGDLIVVERLMREKGYI